MSTKITVNGKTVYIESDDKELEERLARHAVDLAAGKPQEPAVREWRIKEFVDRCAANPVQLQWKLLKRLVESPAGTLTRSDMVSITNLSGQRLGGIRGSMAKNAKACGIDVFWRESFDQAQNDYRTTLDPAVWEALKTELSKM